MNKSNAHLFLPLVQALAEGKTIQVKLDTGEWLDAIAPAFNHSPEYYRIKPEPVFDWAVEACHKNGRKKWVNSGQTRGLTEEEMKGRLVEWNNNNPHYAYRARKIAPIEEALT